jgi:hypothetical protein
MRKTYLSTNMVSIFQQPSCFDPRAGMFTSLKQIYYRMPMAIKSCFLYLSVFTRGSDIDKAALLHSLVRGFMVVPNNR